MNTPKTGEKPFWKAKELTEMTEAEWESLCDGCGRCCLNKLEDWDTGQIYFTCVACVQLDDHTCSCKSYATRFDVVPDCIDLTPDKIYELKWLPPTCAYRLLADGKDLYDWHPLVSGDPESVHKAGISVRGRTISEEGLEPDDYEEFLVDWPGKLPGKGKRKK